MATKFVNAFRFFWADAKSRPPRNENLDSSSDITEEHRTNTHQNDVSDEEQANTHQNEDSDEEQEEIIGESFSQKQKSKFKKSQKNQKACPINNVNTQATGNVINIIGSNKVHWGNEFIYYMGNSNSCAKEKKTSEDEISEENIKKDNLILLLMESTVPLEHEYIDYVSKNLGRNWHSFFRKLGFTKGRIETIEIDEARNGVSEARYKLLLDWSRNATSANVGRLASLLWSEGERSIVKELSIIYSKNK